jgi:hypothetical protein
MCVQRCTNDHSGNGAEWCATSVTRDGAVIPGEWGDCDFDNIHCRYIALHTDKKENQIFLIYKENQNGSVAKSYMTNGLLIYGEIFAHLLILGSTSSYMTF